MSLLRPINTPNLLVSGSSTRVCLVHDKGRVDEFLDRPGHLQWLWQIEETVSQPG